MTIRVETHNQQIQTTHKANERGEGTRKVLIRQFQQVCGDVTISPETCHFFLDMSNWNIQTALGNYYDYGASNNVSNLYEAAALNMQLVNDVTIGEGEAIPPNTRFTKTWRVRNNGLLAWPPGSCIAFMEGAPLSFETAVLVPSIEPGDEIEISVDMQSPGMAGMYQSRWHLNTFQRVPFGESIWCIITVDQNGIMDITQQLASAPLADRSFPTMFGLSSAPLDPNPRMDIAIPMPNPFQLHGGKVDEGMEGLQTKDFDPPLPMESHDTPNVPPCTPCTPPGENPQ
ncbi:hypothetical protein PRIPAC_95473 [Pristionchus pacificus]|uniref:N_BRCA1_IG domain-containing protein n=1 Tax=Pristionchus pacificus TaxID=54126 RepID=A0A2A6BD35_PRIPA|nr:hypothetical protein PRIPAC_95473 [Pristionchus pacificus]|eukprot:PDM63795.1 hypothetical protein PRIPAC_49768 [Pristionchus pacificus]